MFNPDQYKNVFQPIKIRNLVLKNRLQFSPHVNPMTTHDGCVTDNYVDYLDMQAATGVGLVTIGATSVDHDTGEDFAGELDITDDHKMIDLARLPEVVHAHGAKLSIELVHAGRGANPTLLRQPDAIAPSVFPTTWGSRHIREMTQRDMDVVIEHYKDVVKRLKAVGFDMVMIHAAHGNLLAQFLSPKTNTRHDWYGGSFENRMRFPLDVLRAVREAAGDMPVEMRISGEEIVPGGMKIDETIEFIKHAQNYIDLVHVSGGWVVEPLTMYTTMPPYFSPHNLFVKYAEAVKNCPDIHIPVTTVGRISSVEEADKIIGEGKADIVAMARAYLADPEIVKKTYRGEADKVRPCLGCWNCAGSSHHIRCAVNPQMGRTGNYKNILPALKPKKIVIVGGGVAGMTAAQICTQRGHKVVLFEASGSLGGHLPYIDKLPFKGDMRRYEEWMIRTTMECGADIRLNTLATAKEVLAEEPDALFIATGSELITPPIPGIDGPNVANVIDTDTGKAKTGQKVVVCGGGSSGCECALALAMEGKDVTIVDMLPVEQFGKGMAEISLWMMQSKFIPESDIKLVGDCKVVAISEKGVEVEDRNWNHRFLEADTVVAAFGLKSNTAYIEELKRTIPEVYVIGDADHVEDMASANHMAYNYAVRV